MNHEFSPFSVNVNAKINIGLSVIAKRKDGYHNIETIFYPVDNFSDLLVFEPSESDFEFSVESVENLGDDNNNLCVKAFRLLQKDYHIGGVKIFLHKGIPSGAGLGGGSADAAFTLKSLNEIFKLNIPESKMEKYAIALGSDVPFFLHNRAMFASGRGEILNPIGLNLSNYHIEIVKPDVSVSTKEAYSGIVPQKPAFDLQNIMDLPISEWKKHVFNDFEKNVFEKNPVLKEIKSDFYDRGALYASMSGSGSAIFGIFNSKKEM